MTQHQVTGHYALGRYALDLSLSALRRLDLVEISREAMRMLSSQICESVFLSVWGNHGPTIVFKVDGPRRTPMALQTAASGDPLRGERRQLPSGRRVAAVHAPGVTLAARFLGVCGDSRRIRRICELRDIPFANDHLDAFLNATTDAPRCCKI